MECKKAIAVILAAMLCGCAETAEPSEENAVIPMEDVIPSYEQTAEESAAEETEVEETEAKETEAEETDENEKNIDGIYINVTDHRGDEKQLYYIFRDDRNDFIYMNAPEEDPEAMMGYIPIVSQDAPALEKEPYFGGDLKKFFENAGITNVNVQYKISVGSWKAAGADKNKNKHPEAIADIIDILGRFEPEYIPDDVIKSLLPEGEEEIDITKTENYDEYSPRYPLSRAEIGKGGVEFSSYAVIVISTFNGRAAAMMYLLDYNDLRDIIDSGKRPTAEELEKAYGTSSVAETKWFYIDDTELYDYLLDLVLHSDDNGLKNVRQSFTKDDGKKPSGFSGDILNYIDINSGGSGYIPVQYKDIEIMLPSDKKPFSNNDVMFMWGTSENASDTSGIHVHVRKGSLYSDTWDKSDAPDYKEPVEGVFYGDKCYFWSYYDKDKEVFTDTLYLGSVKVECMLYGKERTAEFDEFSRKLFGSAHAVLPERPELAPAAEMRLSDTPSVFGDENYAIADSYPFSYASREGKDIYTLGCPGVVCANFYVLDYKNRYDTGFECFLERQAEDGRWYEVLPLGEISQVNTGRGHFYNVFEEGRQHVDLDLAMYPILTEGRYRIVKPFSDEGGSDLMKYAAFYDFFITDSGDVFEAEISCAQTEYNSAPSEITYNIQADGGAYSVSEIYDIEHYKNGKWLSVRTSGITANSIGGSYSLRFSGEETVSTAGFDLSEAGRYRLRISAGKVGTQDGDITFEDTYGTLYAEFEIKAD